MKTTEYIHTQEQTIQFRYKTNDFEKKKFNSKGNVS